MLIYLAGPDVFYQDASDVLLAKKNKLLNLGFDVVTPLDNDSTNSLQIVQFNCAAIQSCDLILADLKPFRGTEPDSGTVFEVGMGVALGKKVYGYNVSILNYLEQVNLYYKNKTRQLVDPYNLNIENFNKRINIMLVETISLVETFETFDDVILRVQKDYKYYK